MSQSKSSLKLCRWTTAQLTLEVSPFTHTGYQGNLKEYRLITNQIAVGQKQQKGSCSLITFQKPFGKHCVQVARGALQQTIDIPIPIKSHRKP